MGGWSPGGRERAVQDGDDGSDSVIGAVFVVNREVENWTEIVVFVFEILGSMIDGVMEDNPIVEEGIFVSVKGRVVSSVVNEAMLTAVDEAATDFPILLDRPGTPGTDSIFSTCLRTRPILLTPGG